MGWFDEDIYNMLRNQLQEMAAMGAGPGGGPGAVVGYSTGISDVVGSEKKKKRRSENFLKEDELVTEVMDYLLGITVG